MEDAAIGGWSPRTGFSIEMLAPLHDLNLRFLDLAGAFAGGWRADGALGVPAGATERLAPMSPPQRAAAASCPYALFDLRFHDDAHWASCLNRAGCMRVSDEGGQDDRGSFVALALFYAWHVAHTTRHAAQVLLGMSERTAGAFRATTLNCLPALVASETANLSARFMNSSGYWLALTTAAVRRDEHRLRKVQLFGLQLAAAALYA
jgi:FAD/FMN-containing dehydrogenase